MAAPQPSPSVQGQNATGVAAAQRAVRPSAKAKAAGVMSILVYDENSQHSLAATAALNLSPLGTTVADASNFNSLLASGTWDAVAVDCPSSIPTGGWSSLINYVNGGGAAILSYWDWNNASGVSAGLAGAFDVSVSSSISLAGKTLLDGDTSPAFLDVTVPISTWHDHWGDDGDQFNLLAGATGMAHIGASATPVMARGNAGKTIAAPVLDEVGDLWLLDGSGVQVWQNMMLMVGTDGPRVLVYDQDTEHHFAEIAAFEASPGGTYVAGVTTFYSLLASGPWDAVLMDAPNTVPSSWTDLISYVDGGGHVALSFWDWDDSFHGDPALPGAFDVAVTSTFSWTDGGPLTLSDSGTSGVFAGVTMPNSSWHDHFGDDGDRFTPQGPGAKGLAHVGNPSEPVLVYGNSGRTLAAPVLDEAGFDWFDDGALQLWRNMLSFISEPDASCTQRNGVLGLNPADYTCIAPPVVGGLWIASVDTTPSIGLTTLTTFVTIGLGGPIQGIPIFGHELLILPPYLETTGLGIHNIQVISNPTLVGVALPSQGARIELGTGGALFVVLTNGQDLVFGF